MPTFSASYLRSVATTILQAAGTPAEQAQLVSDSLVAANLLGHDSHGVLRLKTYVDLVYRGQIMPAALPTVSERHGAVVHIDGGWGWGQLAARLATETTLTVAREHGLGAATIGRCNHIGRLGEYVEMIARAGLIGLALCNAGAIVAPYGGRERLMGTNPIAIAVPRAPGAAGDEAPLVVDFATAGVAEGKVRVAKTKGERLAPGLLLDAAGQPSQDPEALYAGGVLLPFGGHKGYGLSLMIEFLGGTLSGIGPSALADYRGGNGTLLIALNVPAFVPLERLHADVEELCRKIKTSSPAAGFDEVLLPGEPERRAAARRLADGISLPAQTWREIGTLAIEFGVPLPPQE